MPRISDEFSNEYLNTEDIAKCQNKRTPPLTIRSVDDEEIGDRDRLVMSFRETDKRMTLNKTNALALAEELGDETDDWKGAKIILGVDKTMFNGKRVPCIRVMQTFTKDDATAAAAAADAGPLPF